MNFTVVIIIATAATLAGCAAPQHPQASSPHFVQCSYEAKVATPTTRNVFEDVFRERELLSACIAAKSR